MSLAATEKQVRDAVVDIVGIAATGRVWNRVRIATNDAQYKDWYVDADGNANVWFIRRVGLQLERDGFANIISENHIYEMRLFRAIADSETDSEASENLFQLEVETVRAALTVNKHLGLGNGVNHTGLEIINPIPTVAELGAYAGHMAVCQLVVNIAEC
ncbi:MAG: hypothetical protein AB1631_33085 [Acidobacteriota bacterium]